LKKWSHSVKKAVAVWPSLINSEKHKKVTIEMEKISIKRKKKLC